MTLRLHTSIVLLSLLCGFDILACINSEFLNVWIFKQITVAVRSKAWNVFARSNNGIVDLNPTGDMDACVSFRVCVVLCCLATGWSTSKNLPTFCKIHNFSPPPPHTHTHKHKYPRGIRINDPQRSIGRRHYAPPTANMTDNSIVTIYYQLLSFLAHYRIKPTNKVSCFVQTTYKRNQQIWFCSFLVVTLVSTNKTTLFTPPSVISYI
jgi:hypothetical protein